MEGKQVVDKTKQLSIFCHSIQQRCRRSLGTSLCIGSLQSPVKSGFFATFLSTFRKPPTKLFRLCLLPPLFLFVSWLLYKKRQEVMFFEFYRTMPSASKEVASVKGSLLLLQKAPSIRPLSFFSQEVNGSGALLARFGKKNSVSNQQLKE